MCLGEVKRWGENKECFIASSREEIFFSMEEYEDLALITISFFLSLASSFNGCFVQCKQQGINVSYAWIIKL